MRNLRVLSCAVLLAALPLAGQAPPPTAPRIYTGLLIGSQHSTPADPAQQDEGSLRRTTVAMVGGGTFTRYLGGEFGFHFLGDYPAGTSLDFGGNLVSWKREVSGITLLGMVRLPLGRRVGLYGQVGPLFWFARARSYGNNWITYTDGHDSQRSGGTLMATLGLDVDLTPHMTLRLEAGAVDRVMDARMSRAAAGLLYRF